MISECFERGMPCYRTAPLNPLSRLPTSLSTSSLAAARFSRPLATLKSRCLPPALSRSPLSPRLLPAFSFRTRHLLRGSPLAISLPPYLDQRCNHYYFVECQLPQFF